FQKFETSIRRNASECINDGYFNGLLESRGYHVVLPENGYDALRKATRHIPQLVITYWQISEMDGAELCRRRLKYQLTLAGIPVVMLSALPEPPDEPRCWAAFLRKPAPIDLLMHTVDLFIAQRLTTTRT
ncbi:response regulator, partial [Caballeronia humi]|uniref:response regulator n=1 Tax=Caballeronia humi TaxID=326474 RepID=UPI002E0D38E8